MTPDADLSDDLPEPATIHKRFCCALLKAALEGAGKVHVDHAVPTEPMDIEAWQPRRSANDANQPHAERSDPIERAQRGILGAALESAGVEPVNVHVEAFNWWADLYFEPDPGGTPAPGLLGKMTRSASILFFHHEPPDADALRYAMGTGLQLWTNQGAAAKKARKKRPKLATAWIFSDTHRPKTRTSMGLSTKPGWPDGFLFSSPLVGLAAGALKELETTRETLLLRLLGTGEVLEKALTEQAELPADALERRAVQAALRAAVPPEGEAVPLETGAKDPVLRACRKIYRRWAAR